MSRGRFYARLESTEWTLLDALDGAAPFDGAIISDRYLAPWPEGHPQADEPSDRLAVAVNDVGRQFSVDPDVARLEHPRTVDLQSQRDRLRPLSRALDIPLVLETLRSPQAVRVLVDAAQISQVRAGAFTAPYLEVAGPDDPRLCINVELLRASRDIADGRRLVGYLQLLNGSLLRGNALEVGRLIARHADTLVLRMRRIQARAVSSAQARALVELVWRLSRDGVRVIVDCAGVSGPALVAAGADGFSAGAYRFQSVPAALHPAAGGGGSEPLVLHVMLSSSAAAQLSGSAAGAAPSDQAVPDADNPAVRLANFDAMRNEARKAAQMGPATYAEMLMRAGQPQGRVWAAELRRVAARAA